MGVISTRLCLHCGKPFVPAHARHAYCSGMCQAIGCDEARLREHLDRLVEANGNRKIRDASMTKSEVGT